MTDQPTPEQPSDWLVGHLERRRLKRISESMLNRAERRRRVEEGYMHIFTVPRDVDSSEVASRVYSRGVDGTCGGPGRTLKVFKRAGRAEVEKLFDEAVREARIMGGQG